MFKQYLIPAILISIFGVNAEKSAEDVILAIIPEAKDCSSAKFVTECRTAKQAALPLVEAFKKYEIYSPFEIGAILALIGFESGNFSANINHYPPPGRPGQGTRNMMMINFIVEYAKSIPELVGEVDRINLLPQDYPDNSTSPEVVKAKNDIRALVLDDEYSFATGAWYLATKCSEVRAELQKGTDEGWEKYNRCVTNMEVLDPDRTKYWTRAKTAWNPSA